MTKFVRAEVTKNASGARGSSEVERASKAEIGRENRARGRSSIFDVAAGRLAPGQKSKVQKLKFGFDRKVGRPSAAVMFKS